MPAPEPNVALSWTAFITYTAGLSAYCLVGGGEPTQVRGSRLVCRLRTVVSGFVVCTLSTFLQGWFYFFWFQFLFACCPVIGPRGFCWRSRHNLRVTTNTANMEKERQRETEMTSERICWFSFASLTVTYWSDKLIVRSKAVQCKKATTYTTSVKGSL